MSSPEHPRARRAALVSGVVLAAVVVVALVASTVLGGTSDEPGANGPAPTPSDTGTPLADVDTTVVAVARQGFCDAVAPEAVARALGTDEEGRVRAARWENGERARLGNGLRDVAHEYGCSWRGPDGTVARAWVFVPPVTRAEASTLADAATQPEVCSVAEGEPAYGARSVAVTCEDDGGRERSFRGLFGDAWLTCGLREKAGAGRDGPPGRVGLAERASVWCAAVLEAAAAPPGEAPDEAPAETPSDVETEQADES